MNANRYRFITRTIPFLDDHTTRGPGPLALRSGAAPHLLVWHPEHLAGLFGADRDMAIAGSSTIDPSSAPLPFCSPPEHATTPIARSSGNNCAAGNSSLAGPSCPPLSNVP